MAQMPWFYNWLWWVFFVWFVASAFYGVSSGIVTAESTLPAKVAYIAVSIGPLYLLWLWKRLRTGRWV